MFYAQNTFCYHTKREDEHELRYLVQWLQCLEPHCKVLKALHVNVVVDDGLMITPVTTEDNPWV